MRRLSAAPDITGVWAPYRGGRGADPALAPPPATPLVLKPEYAAPFEARRKAEADGRGRGEPIASGAVACVPYGVPRMMSVALYPIEILPTPGQITIVDGGVQRSAAHLHERAAAADRRRAARLLRTICRPVGRRHARRRHRRHQDVRAGVPEHAAQRSHAHHRADPAGRADILHDQITIDDPVVLEKPVTYTLAYRRMPDYEMVEFVCDNNREFIDEKGGTHLKVRDR